MMEHSDTLAALGAALAAAQAELRPAAMNATNPFLKNRYADLGSVIDAARPVLAQHGLAVSQLVTGHGAEVGVSTVLVHSSGEWMASTVSLPMVEERGKSMAQVAGSVITYLRRYALAAVLGMYADEDTDGHVPQQARQAKRRLDDEHADETGDRPGPKLASEAQVKAIWTMAHKVPGLLSDGDTARSSLLDYLTDKCGRLISSSKELTATEASRILDALKEQL